MTQKIHIGKLIQAELERQGKTVNWFAGQIACDRSNVYRLFNRAAIDTELLLKISIALHYDFFAIYSESFCRKIGHRSEAKSAT